MSDNRESQRAPKSDVSRRNFMRDAAKMAAGVTVGAGVAALIGGMAIGSVALLRKRRKH